MAATPNRALGDEAETAAAAALVTSGWTLLGRNVRVGRDELDVVAVDPGPPPVVVVVEVRRRGRRDFGLAEEALDWGGGGGGGGGRRGGAEGGRGGGGGGGGRGRPPPPAFRDAGRLPDGTRLPD